MAATQTAQKPATQAPRQTQAVALMPARLPWIPLLQEKFGVDETGWRALIDAVFPTATSTDSVMLALAYCHARKLDPFKRVVHIVPIWSKAQGKMVDSVWPGIGELRTTAFRTGNYAGRDETRFGDDVEETLGNWSGTFPEWASVTVYRIVAGQRVGFVGPKVYWLETYAKAKRDVKEPNEMWAKRTRGQLEKCAEAAALRAAFPEEIGDMHAAEEMHGQMVDVSPTPVMQPATPRPTRESMKAAEKEPEPGYDMVSEVGEVVASFATVDDWGRALIDAAAMADHGRAYLLNNREAAKELWDKFTDDTIAAELDRLYGELKKAAQASAGPGPQDGAPSSEATSPAPSPPAAGPAAPDWNAYVAAMPQRLENVATADLLTAFESAEKAWQATHRTPKGIAAAASIHIANRRKALAGGVAA